MGHFFTVKRGRAGPHLTKQKQAHPLSLPKKTAIRAFFAFAKNKISPRLSRAKASGEASTFEPESCRAPAHSAPRPPRTQHPRSLTTTDVAEKKS